MRNYKVRLRPQGYMKRGIYRFRNSYGNYDWQPIKCYTQRLKKSRPLNEEFMGGVIFAQIHYLTDHAPDVIRKRWKQAAARWKKKFSPLAGSRFANKYTINRWL